MKMAEPRSAVACRTTVTKLINQLHKNQCSKCFVSITVCVYNPHMCTSHAGNGYSLTTHSVLPTFEMMNKNLMTRHLPAEHDHTHIAKTLQSATVEWGIDHTWLP